MAKDDEYVIDSYHSSNESFQGIVHLHETVGITNVTVQ